MKRFSFRLERVRELRERDERARAAALGDALREESRKEQDLERARQSLERAGEQASRASQAGGTLAGILRNLGWTRDSAAERVEQAADSLTDAQRQVEDERERHRLARQSLRVVENLKTKRHETWRGEVSREEQKETDGLARDRRREGDRT